MIAVNPAEYGYSMPVLQQPTLVKQVDCSTSSTVSDSCNGFVSRESSLEIERDLVMDLEVSTDNGREATYRDGEEMNLSQGDFRSYSQYVEVKFEGEENQGYSYLNENLVNRSTDGTLSESTDDFSESSPPTSINATMNGTDGVMFLKNETTLSFSETLPLLPLTSNGTDEVMCNNASSPTSLSSWSTPSNVRTDDALASGSEHGEMQSTEGNVVCGGVSTAMEDTISSDFFTIEMATGLAIVPSKEEIAAEFTFVPSEEEIAAELAIVPSEEEMAAELSIVPSEEEIAAELAIVPSEEEIAAELSIVPFEEEIAADLAVSSFSKEMAKESIITSIQSKDALLAFSTEDTPNVKQNNEMNASFSSSQAKVTNEARFGVVSSSVKTKENNGKGSSSASSSQRGASNKRKTAGTTGEFRVEPSEKKLPARMKDAESVTKIKNLLHSSEKKGAPSEERAFEDEERPKKIFRSDSFSGISNFASEVFSAASPAFLETVPFPLLVQLMVLALRDVYDVCTSNDSAGVPYSLTDLQYRFHWREILRACSTEELWDYCAIFGPALKENAALLAVHPEKLVRIVAQLEFLMTERLNVYNAVKRDHLLSCIDKSSNGSSILKSNLQTTATSLLNVTNTTQRLTKSFLLDICGNKVLRSSTPHPFPGKASAVSENDETINNEFLLAKCLGLKDFSSLPLPSEASPKNSRSLLWKVKKSKGGSPMGFSEKPVGRHLGSDVKDVSQSVDSDATSHISTKNIEGSLKNKAVIPGFPTFCMKKMEEGYDATLVQAPPAPGDSIPLRVQNRNEGKWRDGQLDDSWAYAFPLIHKIRCLAMKNINIRWARERTAVGGSWVVGKGRGYCWRCSPKEPTPESIRETFYKALLERNKSFGPLKDIENATIDISTVVSAPLGEALELGADGLKKAADAMLEIHKGKISRDPSFHVEWDLYACSYVLRLNRDGDSIVKYFKPRYGDALGVLEALDATKEWVDSGVA